MAVLVALSTVSCVPPQGCSSYSMDVGAYLGCRMAQSMQSGRKLTRDEVVQNLRHEAKAGDAEAQYMLGKHYEPNDSNESWLWNCRAAMQDFRMAQSRMGWMYRWGVEPASKDLVHAYMWYTLAASDEDPHLVELRDGFAESLASEQISEGDKRAAKWRRDTCEMPVSFPESKELIY